MSRLRSPEPLPDDAAAPFRFGVVASRFNHEVTEPLARAAVETLHGHGAAPDAVQALWVPGAFELPMAAAELIRGGVDAVVCVGVLIRGETPHFDVLAASTASAVHRLAVDTGVPVTFGVLTCENLEQALARAGGAHGNKGVEAAEAAIEMARLRARLRAGD